MGSLENLKRLTKLLFNKINQMGSKYKYLLMLAAILIIKSYKFFTGSVLDIKTIPLSQFINPLNLIAMKQVYIKSNKIISIDIFNRIEETFVSPIVQSQIIDSLLKSKVVINISKAINQTDKMSEFILYFLGSLLTTLCGYFLFKSKFDSDAKKISKPIKNVKFQDIIGLDNCKESLNEVIQYFFKPENYKKFGARMRRGIVLYGPPGTGKTTIAKACSNQANVSFFSCNAAEFCQIYVGMGPKKVRDLFAKAKKQAPSIIYIDQLDAFGKRSSSSLYENAGSEKNSTINQILSELDGFQSSQQVLVIGSTNRLQMVDSSLLRAGRFDLKIYTPLPNFENRVQIFKHYLKNKPNEIKQQQISALMRDKHSWSGADIETLLNESVYHTLRRKSEVLQLKDVQSAFKQLHKNSQNFLMEE